MALQKTVVPGVSMWSRWQSDRGLFFNSFLVEAQGGTFLVDPLEPESGTLDEFRERDVQAIVVTNRDHQRAAARFAHELGALVLAGARDCAELTVAVDRQLSGGDDVFGWTVIELEGFKTPGELVLHRAAHKAAISGDAFWGDPAGSLRLMPDEKLQDPRRAALSARRILALALEHLLVGDGAPIFGNAHAVLGAALRARHGVAVQRVNLDELTFTPYGSGPPKYRCDAAEIGWLLGAEKLGYRAVRLAPGTQYSPLHWHTAEEELLVVWDGQPTLRTLDATYALRPGDLVAMHRSPAGAHHVLNESSAPATIVMIANVDPRDAVVYPDSGKLFVRATGQMVKGSPQLDYYAGE
jgi:uncharacterized cupin superfamily protein/glyoxylase-like metal-dependent hydrolase (beta-lactamase superfamily II)